MKRWLAPLALVALCTVAAGCGGDDGSSSAKDDATESADTSSSNGGSTESAATDDSTSSDSDTASDKDGSVTFPGKGKGSGFGCKVTATGDLDGSFTSPDDVAAFSSDYYFSQAEIDRAKGILSDTATDVVSDLFTDLSDSTDPGFTLPPRPEGAAPFLGWFLLNCQSDQLSISLIAGADSTKDDVPFGPGTYDIVAGTLLGGSEAGQFSALVNDKADGAPLWATGDGGQIVIERFDSRGAAGSFTIPLKETTFGSTSATPKTATLTGTFEVTCSSGENCDH